MSREIKFRCWNNCLRKYIPEDEIMDGFGECLKEKHLYIEQYTGLRDKNGKYIYEGDIVNLAYYEKPHGKKRWNKTYPHKGGKDINVVDFEDGYFKFHQEDKDGYGSELAFSDYGEWEGRDCEYKYEAEVIGNIHENPELLGGEG
jgi:uncharacterized phage protein (TIGR01671 family)